MTSALKELAERSIKLNLTDRVIHHDQAIPASRLFKGGRSVTFGKVCQVAFGVDRRMGLHAPAVYQEILSVVGQHNSTNEGDKLTPIIVDFGPRANRLHYAFPIEQVDQAVEVLRQHEERFEPILPFRISTEEMVRLQHGEGSLVEKVVLRMYRLGFTYTRSAGIAEIRNDIIEEVISVPKLWDALLSSQPPVNSESPFQKLFSVTVYRRIVDYLRQRGI